jgi:hypothetical protein
MKTYKNGFSYCGPNSAPWGHDLNKLDSALSQEIFHVNLNFFASMVLKKKLKDFPPYRHMYI